MATSKNRPKKGYVLVVEDDTELLELLEDEVNEVIGARGLGVLSASCQAEALRITGGHSGHILAAIVDVMMPADSGKPVDLNAGINLCREWDKGKDQFPVIIHTHRHDEAAKDACSRVRKVVYYVERPWVTEALQETLARCLAADLPETMVVVEHGCRLKDPERQEE